MSPLIVISHKFINMFPAPIRGNKIFIGCQISLSLKKIASQIYVPIKRVKGNESPHRQLKEPPSLIPREPED